MHDEEPDLGPHRVVVNGEGQYSLLPTLQALPAGWRNAGFEGARRDCLAHIGTVWTDMRPMSVRRTAH